MHNIYTLYIIIIMYLQSFAGYLSKARSMVELLW